jgi:hypothetical protein
LKPEEDQEPPIDPTRPPIDPYDPENNPVRNCLLLDRVTFQYYSDVTNSLETVIVPLSWLVTQQITIATKNGPVEVVAGWSDYFKGVSLMVKSGSGQSNLQVTGVGVIFKDFYDNVQTAWATDINFQSVGAKNTQWMIGGPKAIGDLPWIGEVSSGNYENAPCIGGNGDFIVSKHYEVFTNQVCPVDPEHNSDEETGVKPPEIHVTEPAEDPTSITHCVGDPLTITGFAKVYPKVSEVRATYRGEEVYRSNGSSSRKDFTFTIPASAFGEEGSPSTGGGEADIIFVIDYTGSMSSYITNVANNLDTFISRLTNDNVDYRIGLVQYGDIHVGPPTLKFDYTNNQSIFKQRLQSIAVSGGGDVPESGLEAIMDPSNGALSFNFRSNAAKYIILLTDADVHTSETGLSAYSISQVVNACNSRGVKISIIGPIGLPQESQLRQLSNGTGGQYVDINGDYGAQLENISGDISDDAGELKSGELIITATGPNGVTVSRTIAINVIDCNPNPPADGGSPDEGTIVNSYDMLFRLRWGRRPDLPCDLDFHAYLDHDPSKHLFYGSSRVMLPGATQEYRVYSEGSNSIYLNFDYTQHLALDAWENEVEIITVDGFAGRTLTLVVNRYSYVPVHDLDRSPQVEIVDAATGRVLQTIVLDKNTWTQQSMIVCDIALKNPGQTKISDITVKKLQRSEPTPL